MNGNLIEQIINTQWKNRNTGLPVTVIGVEGAGRDPIRLRHKSGRDTLKSEHYFFADYDRIPEAAQQQAYQERLARMNKLALLLIDAGFRVGVNSQSAIAEIGYDGRNFRIEETEQ